MKKNRGIHKILSMLLCCVMLLGLLPMTALAATEIKAIYVGIDEPGAGESFDFTAEGSCEEYTGQTPPHPHSAAFVQAQQR